MIQFIAPTPGAWLREDIANFLTTISAAVRQDAPPDEVLCLVANTLGLRAIEKPQRVSPPAVTVSTGHVRVSASGERESYHPHTGKRGVDTNGFGFIPGAYVDEYGTVQFSRPEDNPLQGWR